jgi:tetratricopeptide (TPR) repeat protein
MDTRKIEMLAEEDRFDEALAACDTLLADSSNSTAEVMRARAHVYALMHDYQSAIRDRKAALRVGDDPLGDHHMLAHYTLSAGDTVEAAQHLRKALSFGRELEETWFETSCYFLLAFCHMELDSFDKALDYLARAEKSEPDGPAYIPNVGMVTHSQLREEIERRMKSS